MCVKYFIIHLLCVSTLAMQINLDVSDDDRSLQSEEDSSSEENLQQKLSTDESMEDDIQQGEATSMSPRQIRLPLTLLRTAQARNPCLHTKNAGKCKMFLPRYFFNMETSQCERFGYGGCGGNANNFKTLTACEAQCATHVPPRHDDMQIPRAPPVVEKSLEMCELPPTTPGKNCKAYLPRWTFDKNESRCIQFIYSGCGATANMYLRRNDCHQHCGNYTTNWRNLSSVTTTPAPILHIDTPTNVTSSLKAKICDQPLDLGGTCFDTSRRFYFNSEMNRCLSFTFNGCGGNTNNFQTGDECLRSCGGSTPAQNVACTHVTCPMNLYGHYVALGCEPIYDGDACCPTRYTCQHKTANHSVPQPSDLSRSSSRTPRCSYKGKLYSPGAEIPEASSLSACRVACTCSLFGSDKARITCASIECPETLGILPPGKENCTALYRREECCSYDYFCPQNVTVTSVDPDASWMQEQLSQVSTNSEPFRCYYEGKEFVLGEKIEAKEETCRTCICQVGFNGTLSSEFCEPMDCGIEIYYAGELEKGCVPVYYQDAENHIKCCPIGWECPEDYTLNIELKSSNRPATNINRNVSRTISFTIAFPYHHQVIDTGVVTTEACLLPVEVGACKGRRPRFAYNLRTRTCDAFTYGGCGGNQNNFVAREDCIRVCGNASSFLESRRIPASPLSRAALPQFPVAHELSEVDLCTQEPKLGQCRGYFRRYYYAPELDECRSFVYSGCGGNKNNFHTVDSCAAVCQNQIPSEATLIRNDTTQGLAQVTQSQRLTNSSLTPRLRNVTTDRTSLHRNLSVLSFSTENPCNLLHIPGPCVGKLQRFYYDENSASCKSFIYGGCGGNSNNFIDLKECEMRCAPRRADVPGGQGQLVLPPKWRTALGLPGPQIPERQQTFHSGNSSERCYLSPQTGPCRAWVVAYYFDVDADDCKSFTYGGCFGNSNRFSTLEQCHSICPPARTASTTLHQKMENMSQPVLVENHPMQNQDACSLPVVTGNCRAYELRFHWQAELKKCVPFVYTGCQGNENNFLSEADCLSACDQEPPIESQVLDGILMCSFGNATFPLGSTLGQGGFTCGRPVCTCITPPALTCIQKECLPPPFMIHQVQVAQSTTTEPSATTIPCPSVTCRPRCRPTLGADSCVICDCSVDFPRFTVPPIPAQRKQAGPCRIVECPNFCRPSVNSLTGCPTCDCRDPNLEQVQEQL